GDRRASGVDRRERASLGRRSVPHQQHHGSDARLPDRAEAHRPGQARRDHPAADGQAPRGARMRHLLRRTALVGAMVLSLAIALFWLRTYGHMDTYSWVHGQELRSVTTFPGGI